MSKEERFVDRRKKMRPSITQEHTILDVRTPIISFMSSVNQGKSATMPAKAMYNAQIQHPDANGNRLTKFVFVRGTQAQILDTTVPTIHEWIDKEDLKIRESQPIKGDIKNMACNDWDRHFPDKMYYRNNAGILLEAPYLLGAEKDEEDGIYRGGEDVSGVRIGDIFSKGTFINSKWRFMGLDNIDWVQSIRSTNFSSAFIDEADLMKELSELLGELDARIDRYPSPNIAPCTVGQIVMCYNPPPLNSFLEEYHRPENEGKGRKLYRMPAPIIKVDNPEDPDCFMTCTFEVNPDAEGLHFAHSGAHFWLKKAEQNRHNPNYITRMLLGEYTPVGDGGKRIYTAFNHRKHVHTITPSHRLKIVAALDHGNSPCMCLVQWDGGLRVFDELWEDDMLSAEFARDEAIPYLKSKYAGYDVVVTGDPTGSTITGGSLDSVFDLYTNAGFYTIENLTNDKEMRWDAVNYYLKPDGGFAIDPVCERLIDGFNSGYVFDGNAAKRGLRKAQKTGPNGRFSHIQDALQAAALYYRGNFEYRAESLRNGHNPYESTDEDHYLIV